MENTEYMKKHNIAKGYLTGGGILFLIVLMQACSPVDSLTSKNRERIPDQVIHGFTVTELKSGIKEWELISEKADIYQKKNTTELFEPRMKFYNNEGEVTSTMTADEGTVNNKTNDVSMRGNVIVFSEEKKTTLTTDSLRWDSKKEKVLSDDFVRQEDEKMIVTGYGLEVDSSLGKIIIKRDVKVEEKVDKE